MTTRIGKKDTSQMDYGRKPYIGNDDYVTQMKKTTEFSMYSKVDYPWSEFKKPYEAEDYRGMEDDYNIPDYEYTPDTPVVPFNIPEGGGGRRRALPPERVRWEGLFYYATQGTRNGFLKSDSTFLTLNPELVSYNRRRYPHVNMPIYTQSQFNENSKFRTNDIYSPSLYWVLTSRSTNW